MNKQVCLHSGIENAQEKMPLLVTDTTFQSQDTSTVLPIFQLLKAIKFFTVYTAVVKYARNLQAASTHKLQNWTVRS